jgi:hypothetical protein
MKAANDIEVYLPLNLEELQAFSDLLHGRHHIRFNPDEKWTAEKKLQLLTRVDAELALAKAEPFILIEKKNP